MNSGEPANAYNKSEMPLVVPKRFSPAALRAQSPAAMRMEKRRKFRNLERHSPTEDLLMDQRISGKVFESGIFDRLEDECLIEIMHALVEIKGFGLGLQASVLSGAASLCALLRTCRRMNAVFCSIAPKLHLEMSARAATQITPKNLGEVPYPFTEQLRLETRSSDQLKLLREAIMGLATHCAGKCCEASRKSLNRDIRTPSKHANSKRQRRAMVVPATAHANTLTASADGTHAFVSLRKRVSKRSSHGTQRCEQYLARRHEEWVVRVGYQQVQSKLPNTKIECYEKGAILLDDVDNFTLPHSMRSSKDGSAVAIIRGVLSPSSFDSAPHSCVQLWIPDKNELLLSTEAPALLGMMGAINAQDAWFLSENKLAVLWSTGYVHPCGSVVGSSAESACYGIAVYDMCENDLEIDSFCGPWPGKVQTASPTIEGTEALLVVRMPTVGIGPSVHAARASFLHHVGSEDRFALDHSSVMGTTALPRHPLDVENSPTAAAISPTGDCVVAVHRSRGSVIVEVLLRTSESAFVSVQSTDVTHYTTIGNGEPDVFDPPGTNAQMLAASLRLPYTIVFSPCGRFATIVDRRPFHGLALTNHAFVVLDLALRHERCGVRALPLASVEDVAPRGLQWTDAGLWIQARHGALLLWSP